MEIKKFIDHLDCILRKIDSDIRLCHYVIDKHDIETEGHQYLIYNGMLTGLTVAQHQIILLREELYKDKVYGKELDNTR